MPRGRSALAVGAAVTIALAGCAAAPSPLTPQWSGSIGGPSRGVLTSGREVRPDAPGLAWLRHNDRHWGLPRFSEAIERAAARVGGERPGATLAVGDLSRPCGGGPTLPHFSHRSGVDADLLFYVSTLGGESVESPGFVHVGADGLAYDPSHRRWLRFDLEREWLLVEALVMDPQARVEWIFVSDVVKAMLLRWAIALGESTEVLYRADAVMAQPRRGAGVHDDHIHVRSACTRSEVAAGCSPAAPRRPWLDDDAPEADSSEELAALLFQPLPPTADAKPIAP